MGDELLHLGDLDHGGRLFRRRHLQHGWGAAVPFTQNAVGGIQFTDNNSGALNFTLDNVHWICGTAGSPTATATRTPSPAGSATGTPTATATGTLTGTATPTETASATGTATPSPSAQPSRTSTPSPTPTGSPTGTPAATGTVTPTRTATPVVDPTPVVTPAGLTILDARPVPNPDPKALWVDLGAAADDVELRLYTPAFDLIGVQHSGRLGAGWQSFPIDPALWNRAPRGVLFYTLQSFQGPRDSKIWKGLMYKLR